MTRVVNDLLTNVDCGKPSVLLSLDISAAFDTLDHDMLLQRSGELFGLSGRVNESLLVITCPAEPPTCHWLVFTLPLLIFLQLSRRARSSGHCCSPSSLCRAAI